MIYLNQICIGPPKNVCWECRAYYAKKINMTNNTSTDGTLAGAGSIY